MWSAPVLFEPDLPAAVASEAAPSRASCQSRPLLLRRATARPRTGARPAEPPEPLVCEEEEPDPRKPRNARSLRVPGCHSSFRRRVSSSACLLHAPGRPISGPQRHPRPGGFRRRALGLFGGHTATPFVSKTTRSSPPRRPNGCGSPRSSDDDLDPRSFRLGDFGFGDVFVDVPENVAFYQTRVDATAALGVLVDVVAGIDVADAEAFWDLSSVDPETGELPLDALAGFLPVNLTSPEGEGFVTYTVEARAGVVTGTWSTPRRVSSSTSTSHRHAADRQHARRGRPTSAALPLPSIAPEPSFTVSWSGQDDPGGSALRDYDVYVVEDGGAPPSGWRKTELTEAIFVGERSHTTPSYTVARDNAGNVEAVPPSADTTTTVERNNRASVPGPADSRPDGDRPRSPSPSSSRPIPLPIPTLARRSPTRRACPTRRRCHRGSASIPRRGPLAACLSRPTSAL